MNDSCASRLGRPKKGNNRVSPVSRLRKTLHAPVDAHVIQDLSTTSIRELASAGHDDGAEFADRRGAIGGAIETFLKVHERQKSR